MMDVPTPTAADLDGLLALSELIEAERAAARVEAFDEALRVAQRAVLLLDIEDQVLVVEGRQARRAGDHRRSSELHEATSAAMWRASGAKYAEHLVWRARWSL